MVIAVKLSFNSLRNPIFEREANDSGVLVGVLIEVLLLTITSWVMVDEVGSELSDCNSIADTLTESEVFFDPVHLMN